MLDPASGPFLFDTSAESWLSRTAGPPANDWFRRHLTLHPVHISTVPYLTERPKVCGPGGLKYARGVGEARLATAWRNRACVPPVDTAIAIVAGAIMSLLP